MGSSFSEAKVRAPLGAICYDRLYKDLVYWMNWCMMQGRGLQSTMLDLAISVVCDWSPDTSVSGIQFQYQNASTQLRSC